MPARGSLGESTEGYSVAARLAPRLLLRCCARVDRDLDAAVFVATRFGVVRSERLTLPESGGRDVARNSLTGQVTSGGLRASVRETLVVGGGPDIVRMTDDHEIRAIVLVRVVGQRIEVGGCVVPMTSSQAEQGPEGNVTTIPLLE